MSVETELRALLLANAPLLAIIPANRISVDTAAVEQPRPYIVFAVQSGEPVFGLDNSFLGETVTIDLQIVGSTRNNAVVIREAVKAALLAGGVPWSGTSSAFDPENGLEAEIINLQWLV